MRIALWQCEQHPRDVAGNIERLREVAHRAAAGGADLLVCPEMVVTGYNIAPDELARLAEPADGVSSKAVADIARKASVAIVWGFAERAANGGIFNAAQVADATGMRLGVYRKTHLYGELDRARFTPSDGTTALFTLKGWRVGLLICYDVEFPEAVRALALQGVDLVVVPTANMQGFDAVPRLLVPARAYENQLFVAYANCCGTENGVTYGGLSGVAAPDGRLIALAGEGPELLFADMALDEARDSSITYLADRRPDTYGSQ